MRRNVAKHIHLTDKEYRDEIMDDLDTLQLSSSNEVYEKARDLLTKKWLSKKQKDFIDYLKQSWLTTHQNWHEGAASKTPSTNNALESFNLVIKKEETLRERMPLARFLEQCLMTVTKWSNEYANNDKQFVQSPTIELKKWTEGYHWARGNKAVTSSIFESVTEYYIPAGEQSKASEEEISSVKEMRWNTFSQFKKRAFAVWIVTLPNGVDMAFNWKEGKCTCPTFFKQFMCKHLVGLAIRLKYVKPPPAAKDVPIGEKRKRGRPNKATKALLND